MSLCIIGSLCYASVRVFVFSSEARERMERMSAFKRNERRKDECLWASVVANGIKTREWSNCGVQQLFSGRFNAGCAGWFSCVM